MQPDIAVLDAEALLALATSYRTRRDYPRALRFAKLALAKTEKPDARLMHEIAVCGFYGDAAARAQGREFCDALALARGTPMDIKDRARDNLGWYIEPVDELIPSWGAKRLDFVPPPGWHHHNPSIARFGDRLLVLLRCVEFWLDHTGSHTERWQPAMSRNFLLDIDPDTFADTVRHEVLSPAGMPPPLHPHMPLGYEDARIFEWRGDLWCVATMGWLNVEGWAEQWLARVGNGSLDFPKALHPEGWRAPQKNWIPLVDGEELRFIYWCEPTKVLDTNAALIKQTEPPIDAGSFRGSSQAIPFGEGWLAVVHTVIRRHGWPRYHFRFAWFDKAYELRKVSHAWTLPTECADPYLAGHQYVMGLCWHPDHERLVMSYQIDEREAWLSAFSAGDVRALMRSF